LPNDISDREKAFVVQMLLRQSPRLAKVPTAYKESIQFFFRESVYPDLTPLDLSKINLELDAFLNTAEAQLQSGLLKAIGKQGFKSLTSMFKSKVDTEKEPEIDGAMIKEMEDRIKSGVKSDDGT